MSSSARALLVCVLAWSVPLAPSRASAQDDARRVELRFTPTGRAQIAAWIESADGSLFRTVRLTESVAVRGVGNRPGALQMNSGFRWPWGRREGVLPVWAHRRVAAGGELFERVIFDGRASEGNASSAGSVGEPRNTRDDYFCLSFNRAASGREALDAVTCGSIFMSNKGRYLDEDDVAAGYSEPWQNDDGSAAMRALTLGSPYPPRRDATACTGVGCGDNHDVASYDADARRVLPEIDTVTMATPAADRAQMIPFDVPSEWPNGDYVAYVEVNVEGDYNDVHNDATHPTPTGPTGRWDSWAVNYGYPYRGQPSVVYRVPFTLRPTGGEFTSTEVAGYGALQGEDGEVRPIDATMTDDPAGAPGSGVDRLRRGEGGERLTVVVPQWDLCNQPEPPPECGRECAPGDSSCGRDLVCGPDSTCVGLCDVPMTPGTIPELVLEPSADVRHSHQWAHLRFEVPPSPRAIARYEMRVGTSPITDLASFERALPAVQPDIERIELSIPVEGAPGDFIEVDFGGMSPETHYYVAVRAFDECNAPSEITVGEITTTAIHFTTVSPCFVATAAWGSPLASRVGTLRRFRDRHLMSHAPGRAVVRAYEAIGPHAASVIREHESLRAITRAALSPLVAFAEWLE
jgi:hypothetical protein